MELASTGEYGNSRNLIGLGHPVKGKAVALTPLRDGSVKHVLLKRDREVCTA